MAVHIAVVDPLPLFQRGVAAVLSEAGYTVEMPMDVLTWPRPGRRDLVLLTLESGPAWEALNHFRNVTARPTVIALVEGEDTVNAGVRAVRAGARSVLPREVKVATLRHTVEMTVDGHAVLPASVSAALASGRSNSPSSRPPNSDQLSWLRELAEGKTVAQVADRAGYSERAMFRLLQSLYQEIGVRTRIEALILAQAQGWLEV